ncbi:MAG: FAD-dependent oxidoreductase [Planctomycetaceae bacterium]|nr:FAD-dependent oxidoreductase [Planctomycetaceae bacterium]
MKVAVIGAGPAGLTAAYELTKKGVQADVYEASNFVGGMCRTFELWGQRVDLGPHRFFSMDDCVNRLWLEVVGGDCRPIDRLTRLLYKGRLFHYPLKPANALWNMGFFEAARCALSYFAEKFRPKIVNPDDHSFESWTVEKFGRRLFNHFFKAYSEKLWGIACSDLDADFARQRIKTFTLGEAMKSALGLSRQKHKTLVDQFLYPTGGTGMVYQRMAERIAAGGGQVLLSQPIRRVLSQDNRILGIESAAGDRFEYDRVISTMPLTSLVRGLGSLPDNVLDAVNSLYFRNTILVYLHVEGADLFPDQWLYVHSPELETGRVTNFRNWLPELHADRANTILALEYWCYDLDPIWVETDELLIERATHEIRSTGLIGKRQVLDGHVVRVHRSYPVYERGYKKHLAEVIAHVDRFEGLVPIGRYGAFKYNNQDHSILMGLVAAESLTEQTQANLWSINTDYDTYHESAQVAPHRRAA